jgi:hypothetical protein
MGLDPDWYARRERALDELLPWDHISVGVSKKFLLREYRKALAGETTDDCRKRCYACGILAEFREERQEVAEDAWGCPPVPSTPPYLNPEEYLRLERQAETKSEYWNGEVYAMAGASQSNTTSANRMTSGC